MRAFLVLVVVLVVLAAVGWLAIRVDQGETTMTIETGEMKEAAEQAVDETKEALNEAGRELRELVDDEAEPEVPADTTDPAEVPIEQ